VICLRTVKNMIDVFCEAHGRRILLSTSRVRLANTDHGIEVHYTCTCGHTGVELLGQLAETA
jgi:hypothetical protein